MKKIIIASIVILFSFLGNISCTGDQMDHLKPGDKKDGAADPMTNGNEPSDVCTNDCDATANNMKECTACSAGCEEFCQTPADELRAFPGAEGFGAYTKGGRGGEVIFVDNLNDSGAGSLRACVEKDVPRICIFRVAGTIELKDQINIKKPFITIAGQTAPGDGIALKSLPSYDKQSLKISTHDVIIRGLRIRTGPTAAKSSMRSGIRMEEAANKVIIDRCSVAWATDDNITMVDGIRDVTIQYSIISEALSNSSHTEGEHSKGMAVSGKKFNTDAETGNISIHHNFFAHNNDRNLRQASFGIVDFVNNVVYNWGFGPTEANDAQTKVPLNVIGNYYKRGPNTKSKYEVDIDTDNGHGAAVYVKGNISSNRPNDSMPENAVVVPTGFPYLISAPHPSSPISTSTAELALDSVLAKAGAYPRDAIDKRLVKEFADGGGKIINSPADVGGWPDLKGVALPVDSDDDGIPDDFEAIHGFDVNRKDGAEDKDGDGYTNIEEYINSLLK